MSNDEIQAYSHSICGNSELILHLVKMEDLFREVIQGTRCSRVE